ncbi:MAG: UDP-N-acetylmuramoyl-L-alanine--D-glutamate ligase [Oscillospiraceae bacterium]|jgi:UDP-N-acetylmuramoylalanine--D-glutamate ligase|nr:UDP-N-acetylmuramoyl-L-alanine--D-glutamate ligase [Oscillospiraceae bacterium]
MLAQLVELVGKKRIALLGFGREGRSSYTFLRQLFPTRPLLIADKNPVALEDPYVTLLCGPDYLEVVHRCDILLKSPGVPLKDVPLPPGLKITCQTDLFLRFAACVKAGVTGSKGKTTTSTLIFDMLRASGIPARLVGNVGVPVLDCFDDIAGQVAVIELSSHQLEFTQASPHVAVWTNLYEEHLEHYTGGFAGYAAAKAHIFQYQAPGDLFISNADQPLEDFDCVRISRCKARRCAVGVRTEDSFLQSLESNNPRLRGAHNRQDIYFAATAALELGATHEGIRRAVAAFRGIPHRMEPISNAGGIKWVDDCISTIPHSVCAAIDALETVDTLILGGFDRGLDYRTFAKELIERNVRNLICMPETGYSIAKLLRALGSGQHIVLVETMEEAVATAAACTAPKKNCLLSPAAASYNIYKNFEEKGAHFAACIARLY